MNNLKFLRESRKLSQRKLGEMLGISGRRVSTYESGQIEPDLQTLIQFADFFGVSIDDLVGRSNDVFRAKSEMPLALEKFGVRVRQYRIQQGLSGKELAQKVGITPQYLLVIETGGKIPKLETCLKIINALNASADSLFMDSLNASCEVHGRYTDFKLAMLNPENQRLALEMLDALVETLQAREANSSKAH